MSYRDGVMEHEPKACAAVKGTQIMVKSYQIEWEKFLLSVTLLCSVCLGGEFVL